MIVVMVVAAVGAMVSFNGGLGGLFGPQPAFNSPSNPLTGQQLWNAYTTNQTQADSTYTNKILYVRDTLSVGGIDPGTGQYYSSLVNGMVVLYWSDQAASQQMSPGQQVLARCTVTGMRQSQGGPDVLYLENCDLIFSADQQ